MRAKHRQSCRGDTARAWIKHVYTAARILYDLWLHEEVVCDVCCEIGQFG